MLDFKVERQTQPVKHACSEWRTLFVNKQTTRNPGCKDGPHWYLDLELSSLIIRCDKSDTSRQSRENMEIRISRSAPALVPGTSDPEKVLHSKKSMKSFVIAKGDSSRINDPVDLSDQPSCTEKDNDATKASGLYLAKLEIGSVLVTALKNLVSIGVKENMRQSVEETFADALYMGLNTSSTGVIKAYFQFVESALTNMSRH